MMSFSEGVFLTKLGGALEHIDERVEMVRNLLLEHAAFLHDEVKVVGWVQCVDGALWAVW